MLANRASCHGVTENENAMVSPRQYILSTLEKLLLMMSMKRCITWNGKDRRNKVRNSMDLDLFRSHIM